LTTDDLRTPLKPKRAAKSAAPLSLPVMKLVPGALIAIVAGGITWVMLVDNPLGGEPIAVTTIQQPAANAAAAVPEAASRAEKQASGPQTVTIIDGKSGVRTDIAVRPGETGEPAAGIAPPLDARLAEVSKHGAIPRIGPDGARPMDVYSRADAGAAGRKGPQIAIVLTGLGIGASVTGDAIVKLPNTVTLAFTPYGSELTRWISKARSAGHELILQIPMEPFDYPDNDPGPQTLLATLSPAQNVDRLHWFLSRFQGYVGVTNFMGARFTSSEPAFSPVLGDIAKRGLLFFDDAGSPRSVAQKVATNTKTPFLKADIVIDAKPTWSEIDIALERLERLAASQGFAVGTAAVLPVTIERIARWAKAAESRGIRIVPLSAIAGRSKQS